MIRIRSVTWLLVPQDSTARVDAVFVVGNAKNAEEHDALMVEQTQSHDLLQVPCKENCMNKGKTFLMYERIYQMVRTFIGML